MIATMTSKGQVTLPKSIRDRLCLGTGDKIEFRLDEQGRLELVPIKKTVAEVFGCLSRKIKGPVSIESMNAAVRARFKAGV